MKYQLYIFKRHVEDVLMYPFILLGKLIAILKPLPREYETFFFFPFHHIGGAEKVHAQVARATGNANCIIFFTRQSANDLFYDMFKASGCEMRDISKWTDNKWIYFVNIIWRGRMAHYINRQQLRPVVFNGQCNFGYKLSPWIAKEIPQIELIHSLCSFSYIRIPFLPFITATVMISTIRIQEHLELYKRYGIPANYGNRIRFIMNAIELPAQTRKPVPATEWTVLYVGRSTPEKRVHLIAQMAKQAVESQQPLQFEFLGEVKEAIPAELHAYCHFWGNQSDTTTIDSIYTNAAILMLVSDTEGFPMVVMEAMARGLAIVTTPVGELPLHIKDGENGYLLPNTFDEASVVSNGLAACACLSNDPVLWQQISEHNQAYAFEHFGMARFINDYQQLFSELRPITAHV